MTCDVCDGAKVIRVHTYERASSIAYEVEIPAAPRLSSKTFPCPQCCSKLVADERVEMAGVALQVPARYKQQEEDLFKDQASRVLANAMLKNQSIRFERYPSERPLHEELRGMVGIISRTQINRIEDRAEQKALELLSEVISQATDEINQWGSHFSGQEGPIAKGHAISCIRRAFDKVSSDTKAKKRG